MFMKKVDLSNTDFNSFYNELNLVLECFPKGSEGQNKKITIIYFYAKIF